jgi:hypothetical protein
MKRVVANFADFAKNAAPSLNFPQIPVLRLWMNFVGKAPVLLESLFIFSAEAPISSVLVRQLRQ